MVRGGDEMPAGRPARGIPPVENPAERGVDRRQRRQALRRSDAAIVEAEVRLVQPEHGDVRIVAIEEITQTHAGGVFRPGIVRKRLLRSSEERRVGKGWVSTGRSRWSPYN